MEFISLPNPPVPSLKQRVTLDDQDFNLTFEWSMRSGWYLGMTDANEEVIFYPRKLVVDSDFLKPITSDRAPSGVLILIDMTGLHQEAGYDDLGQRTKLAYVPFAEAVTEGWR